MLMLRASLADVICAEPAPGSRTLLASSSYDAPDVSARSGLIDA